ncbi:MAG TPA: metal ABC transporter permease, partial [Acidimicrobiales bacterium]|nr:metal ABC transporter permease [Acidimicrobiales bacterium]
QALVTALTGVCVIAVALLIARPLLFASVDEAAAAAAGVPVRLIGLIFIVLVGVTAGEATQVVGSLLVLGLLAGPAATTHLLARDPWRGVVLSVTSAVLSMWLGVAFAYAQPRLPVSFCVLAVSTAGYAAAALWSRLPRPAAAGPEGGSRFFGSRRARAARGPG